ncbi:MAG: NeuD/PglB/VioB family sugar acetyltransferase [Magnetococcales bacterium]|nr:NeuD/PglB/VioB family sugar acetyltransferase [Magnetococcales bacterium]
MKPLNNSDSLILLGGGGHGRVLLASLVASGCKNSLIGIIDPMAAKLGKTIGSTPVLGVEERLVFDYPPTTVKLLNGVGSIGSTVKRRKLYDRFIDDGYEFASVIHPTAYVADGVVVGVGAQIMAGAIIQTGCTIGDNVLINSGAVVEHDVKIANHVHIATGAVVAGGVELAPEVHIGCGATVIQGRKIGVGSVVGAGAVVLQNVSDGVVVAGVPAAVLA